MSYMTFPSLCLEKKKKRKNHKNTPTAEALYLTSSIEFLQCFPTVVVPLNILMKKTLLSPLSFVDLALSLSQQMKSQTKIANQNLKPHPPGPPPQVPELQPFSHCPHEHKTTSSLPQKHKSTKMRFIDKDMREKEKPKRWEREIGEEEEEEEEERCGLCDL
jgi:hypothetical protein